MLKIICYIVVLFFLIPEGSAQKIIEKSWDGEGIERINVVSDQIFNIKIVSDESETIDVIAKIEGEHSENVVLNVSEDKSTLSLSTGYSPYFKLANDKLAAHKVISIEIELHIPENLQVFVKASIASVETNGSFEEIHLELGNGNCLLKDFEGGAHINTRNGNITVYARETVSATGKTKTGTLQNELLTGGVFSIMAQSVNGDITLLKSQ